jgi:hypothetical protein
MEYSLFGRWPRISNACTARRASALQSTPVPLPFDPEAAACGDVVGASSTGGAMGIAVSALKRRGSEFSARMVGIFAGGKYISSTD